MKKRELPDISNPKFEAAYLQNRHQGEAIRGLIDPANRLFKVDEGDLGNTKLVKWQAHPTLTGENCNGKKGKNLMSVTIGMTLNNGQYIFTASCAKCGYRWFQK